MAESEISQKWIEVGYQLFAADGPWDFKVEKLASQLGMNKSGFYHYFYDRDFFFSKLMEHHIQIGIQFSQEVARLKEFYPDYLNVLVKYQDGILVQMQLLKNANIPLFSESYDTVKNRNNKVQIPLWAKYMKLTDDQQLATELYELARGALYLRITSGKLTFDFLAGVFEGMKLTAEKLRLKK
jgi:hypothetical protein